MTCAMAILAASVLSGVVGAVLMAYYISSGMWR